MRLYLKLRKVQAKLKLMLYSYTVIHGHNIIYNWIKKKVFIRKCFSGSTLFLRGIHFIQSKGLAVRISLLLLWCKTSSFKIVRLTTPSCDFWQSESGESRGEIAYAERQVAKGKGDVNNTGDLQMALKRQTEKLQRNSFQIAMNPLPFWFWKLHSF